MPNVLIRNVPEPVVEAIKQRAERRRRSLQQELLTILEEAASAFDQRRPAEVAAKIRSRLAQTGRTFGDSAALIREDRDR